MPLLIMSLRQFTRMAKNVLFYYKLKMDTLCKKISPKYKFQFDLNGILSYLVYGRIIFPSSKKATTEQTTLKPLERQILSDFELSKFIVCTDAGLSSTANRKFNDIGGRGFITTQSIKKLKQHLMEWAIDPGGWQLAGDPEPIDRNTRKIKTYNVGKLDRGCEQSRKRTFFKERWINEDGLEQRMIVTYSLKYDMYQKTIRGRQIERAEKLVKSNPGRLGKAKQNDFKRFIERTSVTPDGEKAEKDLYHINKSIIMDEERFDGFYAVCTNLTGDIQEIVKINKGRWEIEETFRIMKSEFKSRPVFLSREDRIRAHFLTCFLSMVIYRIIEKRTGEEFTCPEIIREIRDMNFQEIKGQGYTPTYTRGDFTDKLHEAFGFRTDYEVTTMRQMKKIIKMTKSHKKEELQ